MSTVRAIGIAGFTGRMARLITQSLLDRHPKISIHGICRSPDKVNSSIKSHPNVKIFQAASDDRPAIRRALDGCGVSICCYLGDDKLMVEGQKVLIDASIEAGVARYIAADWCLDYRQLQRGDLPPKDPMMDVNAYLDEKESAGLIKQVHVFSGAFMEVLVSMLLGGPSPVVEGEPPTLSYWGSGDEPLEMTTVPDAAAVTVEIAADATAVGVKNFLSDKKSAKQIAQAYETAYGVAPRLERKGSLDEMKSFMNQKYRENPADIYAWLALYYLYWITQDVTRVGDRLDNDKYQSVRPTPVGEFMKTCPEKNVKMSYMTM